MGGISHMCVALLIPDEININLQNRILSIYKKRRRRKKIWNVEMKEIQMLERRISFCFNSADQEDDWNLSADFLKSSPRHEQMDYSMD